MTSILQGLLAGGAGAVAAGAGVALAARRRIDDESRRADQAREESRQSRRLAEVGTLTGVLAHEIKNPLSTIGLNLQLLQEDLDASPNGNERMRSRLATVQRETTRLRDLLDDFLRYAGQLELDRKPTDLNRLLQELADFFAPQAQLQRVQIRLAPMAGAGANVVAEVDARALKQAVLNLMINAVQAMTSGGDLMLSAKAEAGDAVVDITDTGPGIAPEALDKIFQAYYSTKRGGTGLGLAMARRIAQEHGGSLTVQSELGKGTRFSLRLPMKTIEVDQIMAEQPATKAHILVVDDEQEHAQVMCEALTRQGHKCDLAYNLTEAQGRLGRRTYDVIVTDLMMEGRRDGMEVLKASKAITPPPPVILVTAHADIPTCKQALNDGAYDYIEKPLDLDYLRAQVNRAAERAALLKQNQALSEQVVEQAGFEGIVGKSESMRRVISTARQVAPSDIPVLIMGESGTGKELIARAVHVNSRRRKGRLVPLNCAGLAESILEDELFGHVRGSFTGAQSDREGRFEHADGGTLFMDEIGDMPSSMQAKLLRVLENGELVRLGSNEPIQVDVRLISATNRNLDEMVAEKQFREDLYFRIKGVTIHIPPLRERREDIPLLIHFFMKQSAEKYGRQPVGLKPQTLAALMAYSWPGNVRQLRNVVENMVVLSQDEKEIGEASLPPEVRPAAAGAGAGGDMNNLVGISLEQAERELIRNTLKMTNGNREQAAKILGIGERTLYRKIREFDF